MESTTTLRMWLEAVRDTGIAAGFKLSPAPFAVSRMPRTLEDLAFCIDVQSENTGEYRDDDYLVRARHTLTFRVAKKVKPLDQFDSLLGAADIEAALNDKMLPRSALPDSVVTWKGTTRTLTASGEHLIVELRYHCDVDILTGHLAQ